MTRMNKTVPLLGAGKGKSSMNGKLSIETDGTNSKVSIEGRMQDILFNWATLTHCISQKFNIPPMSLAVSLPALLTEYQKTLASSFEVDLAAMRREREGGGQP